MSLTILDSYKAQEGGFQIRRSIPNQGIRNIGPFLLLDHFGPQTVEPGPSKGVSEHPHRGFETITLILDGEVEHRDSKGNHGLIGPQDVQWMTAGKGIIHSEHPSPKMQAEGGILRGIQLWVNLRSGNKMIQPRYQDLTKADTPVIEVKKGVNLRLIAGSYRGQKSPAKMHTSIEYYYVTLEAGTEINIPINPDYEGFVYTVSGKIEVENQTLYEAKIGVIADSNNLEIKNSSSSKSEFILLQGESINEPIASYGPFVMNTQEEIIQAVNDFNSGKIG